MSHTFDSMICQVNEKIGSVGALLILPMIAVIIYEVAMRYIFAAPTSWAFEVTTFIYGVHYILGISYTQLHKGHVAIDIFEARLPTKKRAILSIITSLVIFFPTFTCMTFFSWRYALDSWKNWEHLSTSWAPPIYPYKTLMAIGFSLLLIQMIAKLIQDWNTIISKPEENQS